MNGEPIDPHLRKALANAPDLGAAPPAHVSAQILSAAHRAAAQPEPTTPAAPAWWRRRWGASGALATVLLAGFLGLLWRGEPPGPAVDGPAPETSVSADAPAPAAVPVAVPEAAPTPLPVPAPPKPSGGAVPAPAQVAATQAAGQRAQASDKARAEQDTHRAADRAPAAETAATATATATAAPAATIAPAPKAEAAALPAPLPVPTPAPAPAPAPAAVAVPVPVATAPPMPSMTAARPGMPTAPPPPGAGAALQRRATPAGLPVLLPGDQLVWQTPAGVAVPDATWLQALSALAQPHWQAADDSAPVEAGAARSTLQWQRGGAPLGVLRLDAAAVWWCAAGQRCLRAQVPPEALRELLGKLPSGR